ncbi:MAG: hypothetical protein JXJ04_06545 [Spirochaetales bacterium]|nr:hypothetical protein [Spirochaetales bacterium]
MNDIRRGKIWPVTAKLSIPLFLGQILFLVFYFVDAFYISSIDKNSTFFLSGAILVYPILNIFMAIGMGFCSGMSILVAHSLTDKKKSNLNSLISVVLFSVFVVSILLIFLSYTFSKGIVELLSGTSVSTDVKIIAEKYFMFIIPVIPVLLLCFVVMGVIQGYGKTKYLFTAFLIFVITYSIAAPILIWIFGLGIIGAALGTFCAFTTTCIFGFVILIKEKIYNFDIQLLKFDIKILYGLLHKGFPTIFNVTLNSFLFMILNRYIASIGDFCLNSWALCLKFDYFLQVPIDSISNATLIIVSQNFGIMNISRIKMAYIHNSLFALMTLSAIIIIYNLSISSFVTFFSTVDSVSDGVIMQVRYTSFSFLGLAVVSVSIVTLQSIKKIFFSSLLIIIRILIIILPLIRIFMAIHPGTLGIYSGISIGNILSMVIAFILTYKILTDLENGNKVT